MTVPIPRNGGVGLKLTDEDYEAILEFRTGLRRFLEWSRQQAAAAGITTTQHQLLLAIRGINDPKGLTIGQIADVLMLRHHSAVELVDRAVDKGIVKRSRDKADRRLVRVELTASGSRSLRQVTLANFDQLIDLAPRIARLFDRAPA